MKRALRVIIPLLLAIAVLGSAVWYFLFYDTSLTKDALLSTARAAERNGRHDMAQWIYSLAYSQSGNSADIAIEMAQQYIDNGNYTQAERTLKKAIGDGATTELYVALCSAYVQQNKILDAVKMLDTIPDAAIKAELDDMRPKAPEPSEGQGLKNETIELKFSYEGGTLYVNTKGDYPSLQADLYQGPISLTGGETHVWAVVVSEDNLVSPMAKLTYTITGIIEKVEFADPAVEKAVRELLSAGSSRSIYTDELWPIESFTIPAEATSYADLKHFINLTDLTIEDGVGSEVYQISSLTALQRLYISDCTLNDTAMEAIGSLTGLTELTLKGCSLSTIAKLQALTNLEYLDLSENTLRNLAPLSGLTQLRELNLSGNAITELSDLVGLQQLTTLDVTFNSLATVAPIYVLPRLTSLYAGQNNLTDLSGIEALTDLTVLDVHQNSITDITEVAQCTKLMYLNVANNLLTDISCISTLIDLYELDFSYNKVRELPAFDAACELVRIDGSHNQLTKLDAMSALAKLNFVNVDYNTELDSLAPLNDCPLLMEVNAYGTKVTDIRFLTDKSVVVNYDPTAGYGN